MSVRIGLFVILNVIVLFDAQCQSLTLDQAVDWAVKNSEEVRMAEEELRMAELRETEASSTRYATVDFTGQYIYTSEVMEMVQPETTIPFGASTFTIPGQTLTFGDEHQADFRMQVTQPLFTGFGLSKNHQVARQEITVKQVEVAKTQWDVRCQAEETYIQAQKTDRLVEIAELREEVLTRHLQAAQDQLRVGVIPEEVVARADLAHQQACLNLTAAVRAHDLALSALREVIGFDENQDITELEDLPFVAVAIPDYKTTLAAAYKQRHEITSINLSRESLEDVIDISRAGYYPTIVAFGALNYGRPGVDRIANEWMFYQTAGVSLNWTLWDWNKRSSKVQQAKVSVRKVDQVLEATKSAIRLQVESAISTLQLAGDQLELAKSSVDLSEKILNWVDVRYIQGTATETEYLDAVDERMSSEVQLVMANADYLLAEVSLKRATGTEVLP